MSGERRGGEVRSLGRFTHDREVDEIVVEAPDQLVTVAHAERHLHRPVSGKHGRNAAVEEAAFDAAQRRELLARGAQLREDRRARAQQGRSGAREMELAAQPVEERLACLALKLRDLDRHRGRREVQLGGRAGKGEVRGGADENLELAQRGVAHRAMDKNNLTLV